MARFACWRTAILGTYGSIFLLIKQLTFLHSHHKSALSSEILKAENACWPQSSFVPCKILMWVAFIILRARASSSFMKAFLVPLKSFFIIDSQSALSAAYGCPEWTWARVVRRFVWLLSSTTSFFSTIFTLRSISEMALEVVEIAITVLHAGTQFT